MPALAVERRETLRARLGAVQSLVAIGSASGTFMVRTPRRAVIAKHIPADRPAACFAGLLRLAAARGVAVPELLDVIELGGDDGWFALFEHVDGTVPAPATAGWTTTWEEAFAQLSLLREVRSTSAPWRSDSRWLQPPLDVDDRPLSALRDWLRDAPAGERLTLAHGDFAPQNFVAGARGLVLVDWEEIGYAPAGFDAGWLLALNRVGAGPRLGQPTLRARLRAARFSDESLRWGEGVGLLRMYRRADGWVAERGPAYSSLRDRVREHVAAFLREGEDADARRRDLR